MGIEDLSTAVSMLQDEWFPDRFVYNFHYASILLRL